MSCNCCLYLSVCLQGSESKGALPNHVSGNGELIPIVAPSMIRSLSVSGDLHGVQPDPIAADILRKEPEQETFARLKITPSGSGLISSFADLCRYYNNLLHDLLLLIHASFLGSRPAVFEGWDFLGQFLFLLL